MLQDRCGLGRSGQPNETPALAEEGERAGLPAPETLRRLALAVSRHQDGPPRDDATLMLMHWSRTAAVRTVTGPPFPAPPREGDHDS